MTVDHRNEINPQETPLYVGPSVTFEGTIRHDGPQNEKALIIGNFHGDITWNGVLQVIAGAKVVVKNRLQAREMVVAGEITGESDDVVIESGLLRLGESAVVDVATLSLPPGGLEQSRGSVVNAQLRMAKDHVFAAPAVHNAGAHMKPALSVIEGHRVEDQEPAAAATGTHE